MPGAPRSVRASPAVVVDPVIRIPAVPRPSPAAASSARAVAVSIASSSRGATTTRSGPNRPTPSPPSSSPSIPPAPHFLVPPAPAPAPPPPPAPGRPPHSLRGPPRQHGDQAAEGDGPGPRGDADRHARRVVRGVHDHHRAPPYHFEPPGRGHRPEGIPDQILV